MSSLKKSIIAILILGAVGAASSCSDGPRRTRSGGSGDGGDSSSSAASGGGESSVSAGGGSGSSAASSSGAMDDQACADYCALIDGPGGKGACEGANDQYADDNAGLCYAVCKTWPKGSPSDTAGNTLGCHAYHADVASVNEDNAMLHCPHAGPFGEGQCGDACQNFCNLAMTFCTGVNEAFSDPGLCFSECETFKNDTPSNKYSVTNTSGNSFGCRAYHLTAAVADPDTHCPHIREASATCK